MFTQHYLEGLGIFLDAHILVLEEVHLSTQGCNSIQDQIGVTGVRSDRRRGIGLIEFIGVQAC